MSKISINLLPTEMAAVERQKSKKTLIIRISSASILVVILISSIAFGFGITKTTQQKKQSQDLESLKQQVAALKDQEGYLLLLKKRLDTVSGLQNEDAKRIEAFNLITTLIPEGIKVLNLEIAKNGSIALSGESIGTSNLGLFLDILTNPQKNKDKIANIKVESLSKSKTNTYQFELTTALK